MAEPLNSYTEYQWFMKNIIVKIVLVIITLVYIPIVYALITKATSLTVGISIIVSILVLQLLFLFCHLKVSYYTDSICYRFFPFQWKTRSIAKADMVQVVIGPYDPVGEYGGWGIRMGKKGMAYTVSGRYGVSITRAGNGFTLLGTQKPAQVSQWLSGHGYQLSGQ